MSSWIIRRKYADRQIFRSSRRDQDIVRLYDQAYPLGRRSVAAQACRRKASANQSACRKTCGTPPTTTKP